MNSTPESLNALRITARLLPIGVLRPYSTSQIVAHTQAARYINGGTPDETKNSLSAAYWATIDEIIATPSICHRDLHAKFDSLRTLYAEGDEDRAKLLAESIDADFAKFATVTDFIAA